MSLDVWQVRAVICALIGFAVGIGLSYFLPLDGATAGTCVLLGYISGALWSIRKLNRRLE